jgi:protein-glutamine gamma-glutamyltransferase
MKLDKPLTYGLLASILLVSAPHAEHLPLWVNILCAFLLVWRTYLNHANAALPPRWLLFILSIASVVGILFSYSTLFGREAGVTLLILLSSLKLLELHERRDATVLIYLSCFITITHFFYSQSIPTAIVTMLSLLVILATWLRLESGSLALNLSMRLALKILLQAVPLTLLLFILFPRVQGPLWGLPQDAYSTSGLSDSMSPGTLSKLTLSQAVAFRVNFEGSPPPHDQMYWRGPVLSNYDGITWRAGVQRTGKRPQLVQEDRPLDYTVTLEPHNKKWLFALEMPTKLSIANEITEEFLLQQNEPVTHRIRYQAHSQLAYRVNLEESDHLLHNALMLPPDLNPRTRSLAHEWQASLPNEDAIIRTALGYFNQQKFSYTLEPPLLGKHGADDFLFETRQGFCEHYASSFVILMRAAGIPARVVTGYQGGENNTLGGYTVVRQADAHAWAEVWLKERGWLRIDPTAAISPERVQRGLSAAIADNTALPFLARTQLPWLLNIRANFDRLNHQWNLWVLGYDTERQFAFLTRLGMEDISWQNMIINLILGASVLVAVMAALLLRKLYVRHTDAAQLLYLQFCKKLSRAGLVRAPHEGPQDFAIRAAASKPQLAEAIKRITACYLCQRYESIPNIENLRTMRREVAAFKL